MKRSAGILNFALLFVFLVSFSAKADEIDSEEDVRLSDLIKRVKPSIPAVDEFHDLAVLEHESDPLPESFHRILSRP